MSEFHFIRPLWLLAILMLIAAIYLLKKLRVSQSGWDQILPKHLVQILIIPNAQKNQKGTGNKPLSLIPVSIIGLLTIIALAGPTWQKQPQPVFQINQGSVLIMDMSYSMYSTDITPNRLTRARYKAIDLLNNLTEGEVGLVAYAGDAFTISPLTEDTNNIKLLLPSLSPDIMPELGSNPLAALTMADEMLKNAGHLKGDIYWFTDGIDQSDVSDINQFSKEHPHNIHILGIGTKNGAPIKLTNGELLKDNSGAIVIPHLNPSRLAGIAAQSHGNYQSISNDNHDIESLLANNLLNQQQKMPDGDKQNKNNEQLGDQWQESGPYLILIILPLLLGYFRRGNIVMFLPLALLLFPNQQAQAQANVWQDLWKTSDQQAQQKFDKKAYKEAAEQFKQPLWQGSAYYKAGEFEKALEAFKQSDSAQALYNQGNALAKLKKLAPAIEAYKKALAKDPSLEDAKKNKDLLEALKKQQEQQKKQQKDDNKNNKEEQNKDQKNQDKKSGKNDQQQKKDSKGEQQKNKEQQKSNADKNKANDSNKGGKDKGDKEKSQGKQDQNKKQNAQQKKAKQDAEEKKKAEQAAKKEADKNLTPEQKAAQAKAKLAKEQHDKEMKQKYQQLMNKVTDDPYLLLRNKMQLEYQKRRGNNSNRGVDKKW